ncbi:unnamed protein product [Ectocarpus sp. 8 AP-2014]
MAYTFQQHVLCDWRPLLPSTDPAAGGTGGGCSIVGPAYTLCVRPQRPSRYSCLRLLMSLFSEAKAWELASFVSSSKEKLGVSSAGVGSDSRGRGGGGAGVGGEDPFVGATPPSAKRARNSLSRSSSLGSGGRGKTGPLDMRALSFVCCTLAGLPYQVQEEPLFVIDYVNRQMSLQGSQCLELLHTLLARKGVPTPPPDSDDIDEDHLGLHAARERQEGGHRVSGVADLTTPESNSENGNPRAPSRSATAPPAVGGGGSSSAAGMGAANAEEESMMHLRKTCSAAAAFSMLLRLKVYLKSAYGLTAARCQSYKPNDATKANEKQAQSPNPPPETFNPFTSAKKGAGKNVVDTSSIAAAATSAAEVLDSGSPVELSAFYMELRRLAQDDPEDYAGWEGLEEAVSDGQDGGGGGETDAGSGSDNNAPKKRGKKRALASSTGGARAKKRRASAGDALSTAKKRGGVAGRGKGVRTKGKKAKTARRRKSTGGLAAISDSSERDDDGDDEDGDEDWA